MRQEVLSRQGAIAHGWDLLRRLPEVILCLVVSKGREEVRKKV
jgi:hypothetical protein